MQSEIKQHNPSLTPVIQTMTLGYALARSEQWTDAAQKGLRMRIQASKAELDTLDADALMPDELK